MAVEHLEDHIEGKIKTLENTNYDPEYIDLLKRFITYLRKKESVLTYQDEPEDAVEEIYQFLTEEDIDDFSDKTNFFLKFIYGYKDETDLISYSDIDLYIEEQKKKGEEVLKKIEELKPYLHNELNNYNDFERHLLRILKELKLYNHVD